MLVVHLQHYGNQVQILASNGLYYRYCHMLNGSNNHINVGDRLTRNDYVGRMGNTGNSTGTHLHLECSTTQNWSCSTFLTPGDDLGWGNTRGDILEYTSSPVVYEWIYKDEYLNDTEKENNANVIYNYLKGTYNLNNKTIGALLGNMDAESTLEPWLTERRATNPRLWFSTAYSKARFN